MTGDIYIQGYLELKHDLLWIDSHISLSFGEVLGALSL
jgi:hypothetical protein